MNKLIEGNILNICVNSINAKMINGENLSISSDNILEVEAIYAKQASLNCRQDVKVGLLKGNVNVSSPLIFSYYHL